MKRETALSSMLAQAVDGRGVASISIIEAPGAAARTSWIPASPDEPRFLAYSITKTFTASIVLGLCDSEALTVDAPLSNWFPQIASADRISVRQLMNHTAGIRDYG